VIVLEELRNASKFEAYMERSKHFWVPQGLEEEEADFKITQVR